MNFYKKGDKVKLGKLGKKQVVWEVLEDSDTKEYGKTKISYWGYVHTVTLKLVESKEEFERGDDDRIENHAGSYSGIGDSNEKTNSDQIIRKALITYVRSLDMENADLRHVYDVLKELEGVGW